MALVFLRRSSLRLVARRCIGWVLAIVYSATALGLPMPLPNAEIVGETAFPCQGKRCGCRTAEQCWKSCCCHTASERLAWARQRGIAPPRELVALAVRESAAGESSASPVRSCCAAKRTCCESRSPTRVEAESSTACSHSLPEQAAQPNRQPTRPSGVVWISPLDARGCRGEASAWITGPISLPAAPLKQLPGFEPQVQPLQVAVAVEPHCPSFSPADPPPRAA